MHCSLIYVNVWLLIIYSSVFCLYLCQVQCLLCTCRENSWKLIYDWCFFLTVYYPDPDNNTLPAGTTFGVYYYITGYGGILPAHLYRDYLSRIASHGYVVLGSWPLVTGEGVGGINFTAGAHINNIEYVSDSSSFSRYMILWNPLEQYNTHLYCGKTPLYIQQVTTMLATSKMPYFKVITIC